MKKLLYIGNKLSKHGNTATSIETLGSFLEQEGYTVFYASSRKNKVFRLLDMILSTIRYSQTVGYVLIDVYSTTNFWYAFIISQLCRVLGVQYIAKLHGGNLPYRLQNNPKLCDFIFLNAFQITAPSGYLLHEFQKKYSQNLLYIPNTIEITKYSFYQREIKTPKLFWVRSFSGLYNPKMAISVLKKLKNEYPDAELCMVGPDKENIIPECKKFAQKLGVEVQFTGKLSKEEWRELSKSYNIFINTTHFDNMPVSVIEAMALGLPVVSTNVGGIPYLVEHDFNALLVPDSDIDAMTSQIIRLVNDPDLQKKLTWNGRETVSKFDWEIVKNQWMELLQ